MRGIGKEARMVKMLVAIKIETGVVEIGEEIEKVVRKKMMKLNSKVELEVLLNKGQIIDRNRGVKAIADNINVRINMKMMKMSLMMYKNNNNKTKWLNSKEITIDKP